MSRASFGTYKLVTFSPPLFFGFVTMGQAARFPPFFDLSEPLQRYCFLALSILSITPLGSLRVHIAYVAVEVMTDWTNCSLPDEERRDEQEVNLLSILSIKGA